MNGTCDTCKHWNTLPTDEGRMGGCLHPRLVNENDPSIDGLSYAGVYEELAVLLTGPKFGCLHHEAKVTVKPHPDQELMESLYQKILKDGGKEL